MANLEQIAAVDGIDVLFIGPSDLSGDCGKVNDFNNPVFVDALDRAERIIKKSDKFLGGLPRGCDPATAMLERAMTSSFPHPMSCCCEMPRCMIYRPSAVP